ncbi:MAG: VOC family protein [Bacteriovoracia bacterium]
MKPTPRMRTCLWFNDQAEEAAKFYCSLFKNSKFGEVVRYPEKVAQHVKAKPGSVMTVTFELEGHAILGLNGGPLFHHTPSLSYFVWCETEAEISELWKKLHEGGKARMGLDKYPWAERYGWTTDRFGVEWQLMLKQNPVKLAPAFLFVDELFGKGEAAISFYRSIFKESKLDFMAKDEKTNTVMHAVFSLNGQTFVLMEGQGQHGYTFSTAFSIVAHCDTQAEIDHYWTKLTADGGRSSQCGWLEDRYGVSWQIVPSQLDEWMREPKKAAQVMDVVMQMQKLDLQKMQQAYEQG